MTICQLGAVPPLFSSARVGARNLLDEPDDAVVWLAFLEGEPALLGPRPDGLLVSSPSRMPATRMRWSSLTQAHLDGVRFQFNSTDGGRFNFVLDDSDDAAALSEAISRLHPDGQHDQYLDRQPVTEPIPGMLLVTTNEVPGCRIIAVHGDVSGVIVSSRNVVSDLGASLKSVVGGELKGYTSLMRNARAVARRRMASDAAAHGANAVVAVRFECCALADPAIQIAAYGTAVTIQPPTGSA